MYNVEFVAANPRTCAFVVGTNPLNNAPVATSNPATRYRLSPLTVVNSPATNTFDPSGDAVIANACPLSTGANDGSNTPVVRS